MTYNVLTTFFTLLRVALWGADPGDVHLSAEEWTSLFALARRHTVQGIVHDAVMTLPDLSGMPEGVRSRWDKEVRYIESRYDRIAKVAEVQTEAWKRHGIDAVQLKGHTVAVFYPNPRHRLCGDIDWWFPTDKDWEKGLELAVSNGCSLAMDSDGDYHYRLGGIMVEHHRHGLEAEGPEGVLLMLNEHILHHVMVAGVGLRQICDLAMAYDSNADSLPAYRALVKEKGLEAWTEVLDALVASLKEEDGAMSLEGRAAALLDLVLEDGNFGLDKNFRFGGFHKRASLLLRLVPKRFISIWAGLAKGRIRRFFGQKLS